jgi:hypothetical protein
MKKSKLIAGQVMYLGPHVGFLGLYFHKGYTDGIEAGLYDWIAKCPALGQLFVPVAEIGPVLRELNFDYAHNMKGTTGRYVTFYSEVQKWLATLHQNTAPTGVNLEKHHA